MKDFAERDHLSSLETDEIDLVVQIPQHVRGVTHEGFGIVHRYRSATGDSYLGIDERSHQLLNRIEETLWSSEQIVAYVDMLLEKIDEAWYPSQQLLDRAQRMMALAAVAAQRAA